MPSLTPVGWRTCSVPSRWSVRASAGRLEPVAQASAGLIVRCVAMSELLTADEKKVINDAGQLWNAIAKLVPSGPTRDADLKELVVHVHSIQRAVMANAAARAYPDEFRILGGIVGDTHTVGRNCICGIDDCARRGVCSQFCRACR